MIRRAVKTLTFAAKSFALFFVLGAALTGYSCFCHGDAGPYPEVEHMEWLAIAAMLAVYAMEKP